MKAVLKDFALLILWLLSCAFVAILLGWFGPALDDHRSEFTRSDLLLVDQKDAAHQKTAIQDCIAKNGEGVAPKFDPNDVVTGCMPRKGKSS